MNSCSYYEQNKEKCKKQAKERRASIATMRNEDIKAYQALYFQLNKERINAKPRTEHIKAYQALYYQLNKERLDQLQKERKHKIEAMEEPKEKQPKTVKEKAPRKIKPFKPPKKPLVTIYEKGVFEMSFD